MALLETIVYNFRVAGTVEKSSNDLNWKTYRFRVLGVELAQVDGDLVQLGLVDAVGRGGHVPVVQENSTALIA